MVELTLLVWAWDMCRGLFKFDHGGFDRAGDRKSHIYSTSEYDNDLYNYGHSYAGENYY